MTTARELLQRLRAAWDDDQYEFCDEVDAFLAQPEQRPVVKLPFKRNDVIAGFTARDVRQMCEDAIRSAGCGVEEQ